MHNPEALQAHGSCGSHPAAHKRQHPTQYRSLILVMFLYIASSLYYFFSLS